MKRNGKRIFLCLTILLAAALCCATLVACNIDDIKEITVTPDTINVRIGEFDYADYTVTATYGSGKTEESVLTEDMIAPKDRIKFFVEGEYDIDVTYLRTTTTIKVNVRRNVFAGAEFNDLDVVYNGEFYTVEVKNVPEGTTVTYPTTNRFRTAGEYQATAILRKDAYEMKEMTARVTIRKADYDLSEAVFEDQSVEYDGTAHVLEMTGKMPAGLYVDYTITREGGREEKGNSATNAGSYVVEAKFTGDTVNFNEVDPKQAVLTIRQATIDVSGLTFEDKTVVYDRTKQSVVVEGTLPRGVNVTYRNNEHVDAGTYEATAVFSVDDTVNYAAIDSMKAKLIIEKADYDMSAVHFNGTKVTYDGTEKKIEIQGQLPTGITVSYNGNEGTDAGTYEATATFTSNNVNYNNPKSMTATLIIDPAIAQMDQIVFERRRFISIVEEKGLVYDDPDSYNPYRVANEYRPSNVPTGFTMKVEYKKTNDWQADIDPARETDEGPYISQIAEDGYYLVKVTFDGGKNYVDEKPVVRTVIRVDTLDNDDISTWEQLVFDSLWVNPETGNTTGVFMDYYSGACVDTEQRKSVKIGNVTLEYCDCNVFLNFVDENSLLVDAAHDRYVPEEKLNDYQAFAESYFALIEQFNVGNYILSSGDFLTAAEKASNTLDHDNYSFADDPSYPFDTEKAAYVSLNGASDYLVTNYAGKVLADYHEVLAHLFGFADVEDFFGTDKITGTVFGTYCDPTFLTTAGVADDPLAAKGAIYVKDEDSDDYVFIFPYFLRFSEISAEAMFLFCGSIGGETSYGALLSDAGKLFDFFENATPEDPLLLEGRCLTTELYMTEYGQVFRLSQKTKVVVENGANVEKPITNGKDFIFVNKNGSTEHLVYGDVEIYRFLTELPGSCAEESAGYDPDEYKITTETTVYTFCDDDVFATVIKANGNASGITKRNAREDHPQMTSDVAEKFDDLSELYQAFIANYVTGEDVVNEWKIGATNRNYAAYGAFFEYAAAMMAKSNRNMGKSSDYVLSKSVIIGMNRAFSIAINSSGYNYTVDQYRLMVAKLFGFTDLDTFKQYTDAIADVLVANGKYASVDTVSARLRYDGAVLTENGYFVLPYAIKSELTSNKVMAFIFVDQSGAMSIWINDAKNAFSATSFGETAWETSDKYTVEIFGRCLMFEDDGYIMNEDLSQNVVEMIDKLQEYPEYVFRVGGTPENCNETNPEADYNTYQYDLAGRCSEEEWFSFIYGYDGNYVSIRCDECNPFCVMYGDWIFDDVDAVKEHSLYPVPESIVSDFDSLSESFAELMSRVEIPMNDTQTILTISNDALNRYVTFYAKAMEIYGGSLLAFTRDVGMNFEESAVIGLDHPYVMTFGTTIDPANVDYQLLAAHLLGVDDRYKFTSYVAQLVALYDNYREGIVTNKALENGCFFTANESFVFPIAIRNELPSTVLAYLILDADGHVSLWINDIDAALWATSYDADHWRCSKLYERHISGYNETGVNIKYDDCNPFGMIAGDFGEIASLSKHTTKTASDSTIVDFNSLSELFAAFMANFVIPTDGTEYIPSIGSDALDDYTLFYNAAIALYNGSLVSFPNNISNDLAGSAVIGINHPYTMAFGTDVSPELINFQTVIANLFGFDDKDEFMTYAQSLADLYDQYRTDVANSATVNEALENGCFYTTNGSFVFPIAVKNDLDSTILMYVIIYSNSMVSVWVNDITAALWATNFNASYHTDSIIDNELYCKNILFVTDTSLRDKLYCKNMLFAKEINYNAIFKFCDDDAFLTVQKANGEASAITKRVDRSDIGSISDEVAEKFDKLGELYAALLTPYNIQENADNWHVAEGGKYYAEYRRLFRYARDLFASANNDLGKVDEYFLSGSAIVGMNKAFAISFAGTDYKMDEYRLMLAKLFGFNDVQSFTKCVDALASALKENKAEASVATIADRLRYDGAVRTENGYFILPYLIKIDTTKKSVLAFVFVDGKGTMSVWINNVKDAFSMTDFTIKESENDTPVYLYVSGRCVLFENNNEYVGWNANGMAKSIAVEKVMAFASEGDFLIYSPFTDEEGFEVYWFSVYGFETEVIYDDSETANIGTVNKGFYTMVNVASIEDVHAYNQYVIDTYEANLE